MTSKKAEAEEEDHILEGHANIPHLFEEIEDELNINDSDDEEGVDALLEYLADD